MSLRYLFTYLPVYLFTYLPVYLFTYVIDYLGNINIHRTKIDTTPAARAGWRAQAVLLRVIIEFTKEAVAQALALGCPRIMAASDAPVGDPGAAVPTANSFVLAISQRFVPHIETATGGTDISAQAAAQTALGHALPVFVVEVRRPGIYI